MENREIELRIADLFAMLLKRAKPILAIMLATLLLAGGYGMYKSLNAEKENMVTDEQIETAEEEVRTAEKNLKKLTEVEIPDQERTVRRAENWIKKRQEYLDNSLYYAMDPFQHGVSRLTFYVETDFKVEPDVAGLVTDPQTSIVLAYTKMFLDTDIIEHVKSIMNTKSANKYIEELITISNISDRFVEIRVYNNDAAVAEKVVSYLYQTMVERLKVTVGEHSANVIGHFTGYEVDWEMNDAHTKNEEDLIAAQRALESAEETLKTKLDSISEREEAVETAKTELDKLKAKHESTQVNFKNVSKSTVKYGGIGLIAGLVLGCGIALLNGVFGGKIQNQSEVKSRYSFPLLGVLPRTKKVWFDRSIRKLEGEPVGDFAATAQATAQSLLSRIGDRSVCLVSTEGSALTEKLAAYTDGRVAACGNILKDADAVKALSDFDGIVFVEERGRSRVDLIDGEVQRAKALGKEIIGIVLA